MKTNEYVLLSEIFDKLFSKLILEDFVIDEHGNKTLELLAPRLELDPTQYILNFNGRKTPVNYCKAEVEWYNSQSLYVKDIPGKVPKIWEMIADKNGKINSNYGWCIYSDENYNQYKSSLQTLLNDKNSRRATMIYTRPSIQVDYNKDSMSDFICTFATQQLIRNNELHYIVMMRSQDAIYGFFNDFYWQGVVYEKFYNDLKKKYSDLKTGKMIWIANSFHVYERHFDMLKKIIKT
jgi:thymidylate synthase